MSETEFESELETNPNKYIIEIGSLPSTTHGVIIHELVNKIADDFTLDEASELFSVDENELATTLANLENA